MAAFGSLLSATGQGAATFGTKYNTMEGGGFNSSVGGSSKGYSGSGIGSASKSAVNDNTSLSVKYPSIR